MKLYVCYGTWTAGKPVHAHPCGEAHKALHEAGYEPDIVRSYGLGVLPGLVNDLTQGRREVKEMTGNYWVPVLVLDDETVIQGSKKIIDWARQHPAAGPSSVTSADSVPATDSAPGSPSAGRTSPA
jgi:hypothetical protein